MAFTGENDFRVLTAAPDGTLYGQETGNAQMLASTERGATWSPTGANLLSFALVVDATGRIIATTPDGPQVGIDQGRRSDRCQTARSCPSSLCPRTASN